MSEAIAAVLTLGFTAFVLVFVPYRLGGTPALKARAPWLVGVFTLSVLVVLILGSIYAWLRT